MIPHLNRRKRGRAFQPGQGHGGSIDDGAIDVAMRRGGARHCGACGDGDDGADRGAARQARLVSLHEATAPRDAGRADHGDRVDQVAQQVMFDDADGGSFAHWRPNCVRERDTRPVSSPSERTRTTVPPCMTMLEMRTCSESPGTVLRCTAGCCRMRRPCMAGVRMPYGFAEELFGKTLIGMRDRHCRMTLSGSSSPIPGRCRCEQGGDCGRAAKARRSGPRSGRG